MARILAMPKLLVCLPFLTLAALLAAQTPAPSAAQLPAESTVIDGVLVPVPSAVFVTLDKFAHSNWRAVQRPELARWKPHGDQTEIALLLGAVIAEGFIAVEAEDLAEVKSVGQAVLTLTRGLGVERAALRRSRSIIEHAERGDWAAVRKEWDGLIPDVERGMKELKSEQLAQFVSLGGWLRGAQALSMLVSQDYSRENAAFLQQRGLIDHFDKQLEAMRGDTGTKSVVIRMRDGLRRMRALLASDDSSIPKQKVEEIASIASDLLKDIASKSRRN
jgi:hypothetical protein